MIRITVIVCLFEMTTNITFLATLWVPVLDHIAYYSSASEFVLLNFYSQCGFCLLRWNSQYSSQTANYPTEAVGMYTTCILIHISECRRSRLSIPWSHIPNVSVCRLSNVLFSLLWFIDCFLMWIYHVLWVLRLQYLVLVCLTTFTGQSDTVKLCENEYFGSQILLAVDQLNWCME